LNPYYQDDAVTIYHGDCREILPEISGADLVVTDPPYGVDWRSNRRIVKHAKIQNDAELDWLPDVFGKIHSSLKDDTLCVSFYGWPDADQFVEAWRSAGFGMKSHVVWIKNNIGLGWFTRGQHEVAYLLSKGKPAKPDHAISDVIYADTTGNELHPTQKPESLITKLILPFCPIGGLILDPFMGSGTTLRAAKDLGRKAIGIELNERYCEIAARRMCQEVLL
jgi:site-specific DNA-methyltransferase (adenine-specific)